MTVLVAPEALHRGWAQSHSSPSLATTPTSPLRPRRNAARTVPRPRHHLPALQGHSPLAPLPLRGRPQARRLTRTPEAAGSSAGPDARRPGLHPRPPQALGLRARRRRWTRSVRPPRRGCTGWPRLPHWLRAGRGRARNLGRGERNEPGGTRAAGGGEATESSPRRACGGFPGSATRAATEHAQSPAGGAGSGEGELLGPRAGTRPRWPAWVAPGRPAGGAGTRTPVCVLQRALQ